jgi:hypothetical protein
VIHQAISRSGAVLALMLLAGCGGGGDEAGSAEGRDEAGSVTSAVDEGGVSYTSRAGGYQVTWPEGCDQVRVRERTDDAGAIDIIHAFCDRPGTENEGCAVTAYLALSDEAGGPPTPQTVTGLVRSVMETFQVEMISQRPIIRAGVQGVQVQCREPGGTGRVWVEGLLAGERAYVLSAWRGDGALFEHLEYERFFASFHPVEESAPAGAGE